MRAFLMSCELIYASVVVAPLLARVQYEIRVPLTRNPSSLPPVRQRSIIFYSRHRTEKLECFFWTTGAQSENRPITILFNSRDDIASFFFFFFFFLTLLLNETRKIYNSLRIMLTHLIHIRFEFGNFYCWKIIKS